MRADRLVAILLLLQARGRVTARALAAELEVSVKTARRDLEALSMAGVPVYAQAGRSGGWSLVGGARTDLTGLTAAEARALFLVAGPSSAVTQETRAALRKLVGALPETFRAEAEAAASAVVLDPARWGGTGPAGPGHLAVLQQAVIDGRQARIAYVDRRGAASERAVHPLGLVHKGASWYLVANTDPGMRTFHVSRIRSVDVLDSPVVRPEGFDLAATWRTVVAQVEERRRRVRAVVRVSADKVDGLRGQFGADLTALEATPDGHVLVEVAGSSAETIAQQLAGWGALLEVVGPADVRRQLVRIATELIGRYGDPSAGERLAPPG